MAGRSFTLASAWGAVTIALFACTTDDGYEDDIEDLTEEVLSCEEAASKLAECCPEVLIGITLKCKDYRYRGSSTDCQGKPHYSDGHTLPTLNLHESKCIRQRSCQVLRDSGVCERAKNAFPRGWDVYGDSKETAVPTRDAGDAPNICE